MAAEENRYHNCRHCGTPFSLRARPGNEFCCNGCEYVYRMIKAEGLDHYYQLRDRQIAPVGSAVLQPRDYGWLEKRMAQVETAAGEVAELQLDLMGISCVGCVWLIEKLFREQTGGIRIEINTQYGQVRLRWYKGLFPLVEFAREIQKFGYVLGPPGHRPQLESRRLVGKLGMCGAFAMNAMGFTLPRYLGMDPDSQLAPLFELLALLFATLSLLTGGAYFIQRGLRSLAHGVVHIDLPIAIGIVVAWCGSVFGWFIHDTRFLYFDFVAIFIFLMLTGRWVQERALEHNRHRLLSKNKAPEDVCVVADDLASESQVGLYELQPGMRIRVLPGEVVPVQAELESAQASLSLEWINGESAMRGFAQRQWVPSGAQNIGIEPIILIAREPWQNSLLRRLLSARREESGKRPGERLLRSYIVTVLLIALGGGLTWAVWLNDPLTALQVIISVLVVSCPCAIGTALPLAQEWAVLLLRPAGIFLRDPRTFTALERIRTLVFDKTGTLTLEAPELANPEALDQLDPVDAAVLQQMIDTSLHPVSRALREASLNRTHSPAAFLPADLRLREEIGFGMVATDGCRTWTLGRPGWTLTPQGGAAAAAAKASSAAEAGAASTSSGRFGCELRRDGQLLAGFILNEALREEAPAILAQLRRRFDIVILSGDRVEKVKATARQLGLPESAAIGGQTPEEKAAFVRRLPAESVFFIGDGANDALAFAHARVRGTPATPHGLLQEKADFFFTGRSLRGILHLFTVQARRKRAIAGVFAFALSYNLAVVGVALAGAMHPLLAAILMPLSSLFTIGIVALGYRNTRF